MQRRWWIRFWTEDQLDIEGYDENGKHYLETPSKRIEVNDKEKYFLINRAGREDAYRMLR